MIALTASALNLCSFRYSFLCGPIGHCHRLARNLAALGRQVMHTLVPCFRTSFVGPRGPQKIVPEDSVGREIVLHSLLIYNE